MKNISRGDSFYLLSPEKTYNFEFLANHGFSSKLGGVMGPEVLNQFS